jgi:uncharacterized integral membrane protein (TIGR00698 family)
VNGVGSLLPGLAVCTGIAVAAATLGHFVPLVGGPVFGIVFGVILAGLLPRRASDRFAAGVTFASKNVLQASIVLLGATLDVGEISRTSAGSLPVMLGTFTVGLIAAAVFGRLLKLDSALRTLIGVGTAICGASAIAAVSGVIAAGESDVAYAISTVFLFNIVAVLVFPAIGHALALSQHAFALWAGTAINDTSSVVAAGFAYGPGAANQAIIVKLTRTLLIVPTVVVLALRSLRDKQNSAGIAWRSIFPLFVLWFVVAALLNTIGAIPSAAHAAISLAALFLIVVALVAVGLLSDFAQMRKAGLRPILFGAILWVLVSLSSLALQRYTGQL